MLNTSGTPNRILIKLLIFISISIHLYISFVDIHLDKVYFVQRVLKSSFFFLHIESKFLLPTMASFYLHTEGIIDYAILNIVLLHF